MLNLNPTHNLSFFQIQVNRGENENYCSAMDSQQTNQDHLHVFFTISILSKITLCHPLT